MNKEEFLAQLKEKAAQMQAEGISHDEIQSFIDSEIANFKSTESSETGEGQEGIDTSEEVPVQGDGTEVENPDFSVDMTSNKDDFKASLKTKAAELQQQGYSPDEIQDFIDNNISNWKESFGGDEDVTDRFSQGKFTSEEREAFESWKNNDPNWKDNLPQDKQLEKLQETINEESGFNEEEKQKKEVSGNFYSNLSDDMSMTELLNRYDTENINEALEKEGTRIGDTFRKSIATDKITGPKIEAAQEKIAPELSKKEKELREKYNLTNPDELKKANEELNSYRQELLEGVLGQDEEFQKRFNMYRNVQQQYMNDQIEHASQVQNKRRVDKKRDEWAESQSPLLQNIFNLPIVGDAVKVTGYNMIHSGIPKFKDAFIGFENFTETKSLETLADSYKSAQDGNSVSMFVDKDGNILGMPSDYPRSGQDAPAGSGIGQVDSDTFLQWYNDNAINFSAKSRLNRIENMLEQKEIQKHIQDFTTSPRFYDDKGDFKWESLTQENVQKLLGDQLPQLGASIIPGMSIVQETGNLYNDLLAEATAKRFNIPVEDVTISHMLETEEAGGINIDGIAKSGTLSGVIDYASAINLLSFGRKFGLDVLKKKGVNNTIRYISKPVGEYSTEGIQNIITQNEIKSQTGKPIDYVQTKEEAFAGGILGLGAASIDISIDAKNEILKQFRKKYASTILKASNFNEVYNLKEKVIKPEIEKAVEEGKITSNDGEDLVNDMEKTEVVAGKIPDNVSEESKTRAFDLIYEKEQLQQEIKNSDDILAEPLKRRINVINEELGAMVGIETGTDGKPDKGPLTTENNIKEPTAKPRPKNEVKPESKKQKKQPESKKKLTETELHEPEIKEGEQSPASAFEASQQKIQNQLTIPFKEKSLPSANIETSADIETSVDSEIESQVEATNVKQHREQTATVKPLFESTTQRIFKGNEIGSGVLEGETLGEGVSQIAPGERPFSDTSPAWKQVNDDISTITNDFGDSMGFVFDESLNDEGKSWDAGFTTNGKPIVRINPYLEDGKAVGKIAHEAIGHGGVLSALVSDPELTNDLLKWAEKSEFGKSVLPKLDKIPAYKNLTHNQRVQEVLARAVEEQWNKGVRMPKNLWQRLVQAFKDFINKFNNKDAKFQQKVRDFIRQTQGGKIKVTAENIMKGWDQSGYGKGVAAVDISNINETLSDEEKSSEKEFRDNIDKQSSEVYDEFNKKSAKFKGNKTWQEKETKEKSKKTKVREKKIREGAEFAVEQFNYGYANNAIRIKKPHLKLIRGITYTDKDGNKQTSPALSEKQAREAGVRAWRAADATNDFMRINLANLASRDFIDSLPKEVWVDFVKDAEAELQAYEANIEADKAAGKKISKDRLEKLEAKKAAVSVNAQKNIAAAYIGDYIMKAMVSSNMVDLRKVKSKDAKHKQSEYYVANQNALNDLLFSVEEEAITDLEETTFKDPQVNGIEPITSLKNDRFPGQRHIKTENSQQDKMLAKEGGDFVDTVNSAESNVYETNLKMFELTKVLREDGLEILDKINNLKNKLNDTTDKKEIRNINKQIEELRAKTHKKITPEAFVDLIPINENMSKGEIKEIKKLNQAKIQSANSKGSDIDRMRMLGERVKGLSYQLLREWTWHQRENIASIYNRQSSKKVRAEIDTAEKKPLGKDGLAFGLMTFFEEFKPKDVDGETMSKMANWSMENMDIIVDLATKGPKSQYISQAKNPYGAIRAAIEINNAMNNPTGPENYETGWMGDIDQTGSGPQLIAMETLIPSEMLLYNLWDNKRKYDPYFIAGNEERHSEPMTEEHEEALQWIEENSKIYDDAIESAKIDRNNAYIESSEKYYNELKPYQKEYNELVEASRKNKKRVSKEAEKEFRAKKKELYEKHKLDEATISELNEKVDEAVEAKKAWRNTDSYQARIKLAGRAMLERIYNEGDFRDIMKYLAMTKDYNADRKASASRLNQDDDLQALGITRELAQEVVDRVFSRVEKLLPGQKAFNDALVELASLAAREGKGLVIKNPLNGFITVLKPTQGVTDTFEVGYNGFNLGASGKNINVYLGGKKIKLSKMKSSVVAVGAQFKDGSLVNYLYKNFKGTQGHVYDAFGAAMGDMTDLSIAARAGLVKVSERVGGKDYITRISEDTFGDNVQAKAIVNEYHRKLDEIRQASYDKLGINKKGTELPGTSQVISNEFNIWMGSGGVKNLKQESTPNALASAANEAETFTSKQQEMANILDIAADISKKYPKLRAFKVIKQAYIKHYKQNNGTKYSFDEVLDFFETVLDSKIADQIARTRKPAYTIQVDGEIAAWKTMKSGVFSERGPLLAKGGQRLVTETVAGVNTFNSNKQWNQITLESGAFDQKAGATRAVSQSKEQIDEYVDEFKGKKPNGKNYLDDSNSFERAVYANLYGLKGAEFKAKLNAIRDWIERSNQSENSSDSKRRDERLKDFDKKFANATSIDDIKNAIAEDNIKGVDYLRNILNDLEPIVMEVAEKYGLPNAFFNKFKDGISMASVNDKTLTEDTISPNLMNIDDYISDLITDANMIKETAQSELFLKSYVNSDSFKSMFRNQEARKVIGDRMVETARAFRSQARLNGVDKNLNKLKRGMSVASVISYQYRLVGLAQFFKQLSSIPGTIVSGLYIGKGGIAWTFKFSDISGALFPNSAMNNWMKKNGLTISDRGSKGIASLDEFDTKLNKDTKSTFKKFLSAPFNFMGRIAKFLLDQVVGRADGLASKLYFMTQYRRSLKAQGLSTNVDFNKPGNKKAMNEAKNKTDIHHNVSSASEKSTFLNPKTEIDVAGKAVIGWFADFEMNWWAKTWGAVKRLASLTASFRDRVDAIKDISYSIAESEIFRMIGLKAAGAVTSFALSKFYETLAPEDETEKQKRQREKVVKEMTENSQKYLKSYHRLNRLEEFVPIPIRTIETLRFMGVKNHELERLAIRFGLWDPKDPDNIQIDPLTGKVRPIPFLPPENKDGEIDLGLLGDLKKRIQGKGNTITKKLVTPEGPIGDKPFFSIGQILNGEVYMEWEMRPGVYQRYNLLDKMNAKEKEMFNDLMFWYYATNYTNISTQELNSGINKMIQQLNYQTMYRKLPKDKYRVIYKNQSKGTKTKPTVGYNPYKKN